MAFKNRSLSGPVVIMYHSITGTAPADPLAVSRQAFAGQIGWLLDVGYDIVPLATLVDSLKTNSPGVRTQAVITFDDGYQDFVEQALPVLEELCVPATVFLVTGMLGEKATFNRFSPDARLMDEDDVRYIRSLGIGLGSHTHSHANLPELDALALRRELEESREALIRFGETFLSLSYPWGKYAQREVFAVRDAGYACAMEVNFRIAAGSDLFGIRRFGVKKDQDVEAFARMIAPPISDVVSRRVRGLFGIRYEPPSSSRPPSYLLDLIRQVKHIYGGFFRNK